MSSLHALRQWCTQDLSKGGQNQGSGGEIPSRQRDFRYSYKNTHFSTLFLLKKSVQSPRTMQKYCRSLCLKAEAWLK